MRTSDFDFYLPEELIAQTPLLDRSSSRLLSLDSKTGAITGKHFTDMVAELQEGDALVLNGSTGFTVGAGLVVGEKVDSVQLGSLGTPASAAAGS